MTTPTTRLAAEATIRNLYGYPGHPDRDTRDGEALAIAVIRSIGLSALTDRAVIALALAHIDLEEERVQYSERSRAAGMRPASNPPRGWDVVPA